MIYDFFFTELVKIFTKEKILTDLLCYFNIDINVFDTINIISENEFNGATRNNIFNKNDSITLSSIDVTKKFLNQLYYHYDVEVILGEFNKDSNFGTVEYYKCIANMLYDMDYNLINIDFYHTDNKSSLK